MQADPTVSFFFWSTLLVRHAMQTLEPTIGYPERVWVPEQKYAKAPRDCLLSRDTECRLYTFIICTVLCTGHSLLCSTSPSSRTSTWLCPQVSSTCECSSCRTQRPVKHWSVTYRLERLRDTQAGLSLTQYPHWDVGAPGQMYAEKARINQPQVRV